MSTGIAETTGLSVQPTLLDELQKKIYGERQDQLTPLEINRMFKYPITAEFNTILYRGLQRNALNPDVTILQIIPRAKNKDFIIPIALALRYGADPNMYVDAPKLGTIHILGYVYNSLGLPSSNYDNEVLNTIVLLLLAQGSRPSLPMYDKTAGKIKPDTTIPITSISVKDWLNDQGYDTILNRLNSSDLNSLAKYVDKDSLNVLSILLDRPNLIGRDYVEQDLLLAIRSFSSNSFDKIPVSNSMYLLDYKTLEDAVSYFNADAFDKLLTKGQMPSYLLINKILVGMKKYRATGNIVIVQELERMLISSISMGTQLDQDQLAIVSVMGQDILNSVIKEYEQPYWKKVCKNTDPNTEALVPERLKRLAVSLNLDSSMSKAGICANITSLARADKEALKQAAKRRQQLRMAADMGTMNDFLGEKIPTIVCRNRSLMPNDPLNYNDIDIAYYKDAQGAVWCFTSESFPSLIETGINPYNMVSLPQSFIEQLKHQVQLLNRLGINSIYSKMPSTYDKAIDSLSEKDNIKEITSDNQLRTFIDIANNNSFSVDSIKSLTKDRMSRALRTIGFDIDLEPLTTQHSLVTTSWIINHINDVSPNDVKIFFNSLNTLGLF